MAEPNEVTTETDTSEPQRHKLTRGEVIRNPHDDQEFQILEYQGESSGIPVYRAVRLATNVVTVLIGRWLIDAEKGRHTVVRRKT